MTDVIPFSGADQREMWFLIEKNADSIIVVDQDGIVLFANPATEKIFGRAPQSLIGSPIGIPLVSGETTEIAIHRPGGGRIDAEIRAVETRWGDRPARLASIRDISARKALEEHVRHSTKMEAVGRLTAGIAHDFNNLLTVIIGNLDHAQRLSEDASLRRMLENAMRGARRAAVLTERLLSFARRKPLEPKVLNVNRLVASMSDLLQQTLGENIKVQTVLAPDLWTVEVDPTELEAAVLNLAANARDAMPSGGSVLIETANVELDAAYATFDLEMSPGPYVLLSVSDTGTGMEPGVLAQVFEPFFTTKPDGQGTGLGLSQVYGFVKQSGGHVKLYSEPGLGTTAKIYLPKGSANEASAHELDPGEGDAELPASVSGEKILVVEDDEDVRSYTANSLVELGYEVLQAADAQSALALIEREKDLRLLLTDLGLPGGMDGRTLAMRAQRIRGDLKVLITTAYAGHALVHEGRLDPGISLLSKPFTFGRLARRIRELLDRRDDRAPGAGHILVVDDEALLRMLVVDTLVAAGRQTEEAGSFAEALERLRAAGPRLAAAIVDLSLPDRPGFELVAEIRARRPDLPIIVATGLSDRQIAERFAGDPLVRFMTKPFDPEALVEALQALRV